MLSHMFIAALWSPAGKGLTSWLLLVMFIALVIFPCGILGQVWYLIVSFPDLCFLSYFYSAILQRNAKQLGFLKMHSLTMIGALQDISVFRNCLNKKINHYRLHNVKPHYRRNILKCTFVCTCIGLAFSKIYLDNYS